MGLTDDLVARVARGAAAGVLDWSKEQILDLAARLKNRELAFIRDRETIDVIRAERKSEEWAILNRHLRDKKLRVLVVMGLALRKLEKLPSDTAKLQALRSSIRDQYGSGGLRGAELIQRGVVTLLLARMLKADASPADVSAAIEQLLRSVDKHTTFVQQKDNLSDLVRELVAKIRARSPDVYIILGHGQARAKAKQVTASVLKSLGKSYGADVHEAAKDYYAFIGKLEGGELVMAMPL